MSNPGDADLTPIRNRQQLVAYLASGCKPAAAFGIGVEHEKFGFRAGDRTPPPYRDGQRGDTILGMLTRMIDEGAEPILDSGAIIGLKQRLVGDSFASISLEPAGQLELSGAVLPTLHDVAAELQAHLAQVARIGRDIGLIFAPLGFQPLARRDEMPWMPKQRYAIMRRYMPSRGQLGLDMMTRTCTVQVNLDHASEADMVRKLRLSLLLQPLASALFANSPFTEGRLNGYRSYRAHVWTDTDPDRSGIPPVFFEPAFGFERYVDWVIERVPMYFVRRGDRTIDLAGASFADFLAGTVPAAQGLEPTLGDFADHLTTVFTDVRLKRFLEMRGADAGTPAMMLAMASFWTGILYDQTALARAEEHAAALDRDAAVALRAAVPRAGLDAPMPPASGYRTLRDWLPGLLRIAADGLDRRDRRHAETGATEAVYLEPLLRIAGGGMTQADHWVSRYNGTWNGAVACILDESIV